jgi:hypothetical protein
MLEITDATFDGATENIDGKKYMRCTFTNCVLVFSGTAPVGLVDCVFKASRWEFAGAAATTLSFLRALYHGVGEGGQKLVEGTFESIRRPPSTE